MGAGKYKLSALALSGCLAAGAAGVSQAEEVTFPRISYGLEWTWTDNWGDESYYSWCGGHNDGGEVTLYGVEYNDFSDGTRQGCTNMLAFAGRILSGTLANRQWFQGRLYSYFTGDYLTDTEALPIKFLQIGGSEDFAAWYDWTPEGENWAYSEGVFVRPLENPPASGQRSMSGFVGFGGLEHREGLPFATVNFDNNTVQFDARFEGFSTSVQFGREVYTISSAPIEFNPESGWFSGQLTGTHSDVAGRFVPYNNGIISGFVGGDGGNRLVALYKIPWGHMSSDYLLGQAP